MLLLIYFPPTPVKPKGRQHAVTIWGRRCHLYGVLEEQEESRPCSSSLQEIQEVIVVLCRLGAELKGGVKAVYMVMLETLVDLWYIFMYTCIPSKMRRM